MFAKLIFRLAGRKQYKGKALPGKKYSVVTKNYERYNEAYQISFGTFKTKYGNIIKDVKRFRS